MNPSNNNLKFSEITTISELADALEASSTKIKATFLGRKVNIGGESVSLKTIAKKFKDLSSSADFDTKNKIYTKIQKLNDDGNKELES